MLTNIESRVFNVIGDQFGIDVVDLKLEQSIIDDLGADSIDVVELVIALEQEFKIAIETEEQNSATTVALILELIQIKTSVVL